MARMAQQERRVLTVGGALVWFALSGGGGGRRRDGALPAAGRPAAPSSVRHGTLGFGGGSADACTREGRREGTAGTAALCAGRRRSLLCAGSKQSICGP